MHETIPKSNYYILSFIVNTMYIYHHVNIVYYNKRAIPKKKKKKTTNLKSVIYIIQIKYRNSLFYIHTHW